MIKGIGIDLIENKRINDLEIFLKNNSEAGQNPKVLKFLIKSMVHHLRKRFCL